MSESQLHQLDSRLAAAYGACIPFKVMTHGLGRYRRISDKQIFSLTSMPDAYRQLRYRRLLFLPRLLKSATDSLLFVLDASVQHPGSFAHTIMDDLQWLGLSSQHISTMQAPPASLHQWLNFCGTVSWRAILRNAYHNDNRIFHDDISHCNMLHDIHKLHVKTGTVSPDFTKLFLLPSLLEADQHHMPPSARPDILPNARPDMHTSSLRPDSQVDTTLSDVRSDPQSSVRPILQLATISSSARPVM
jgi:hypothetical protein